MASTIPSNSGFIGILYNPTNCVILGFLAILLYLIFRRNPRIHSKLDQFKGPKYDLPVLGHTLYFLRPHSELLPLFDYFVANYGPVIKIWLGPWLPYAAIVDPVIAEKIMSTTNHINKGKYAYDKLRPWLGEGLLTASKNKWSGRRKLLTPSFHFKILEDFIPVFNEQAHVFVECLKAEDGKKTFDIYPYIAKCTLDVICETAMGKKINAQIGAADKTYIDAVNGITEIILAKITKPWIELPLIAQLSGIASKERGYLKILHEFTDNVIKARKAEFGQEDLLTKKSTDEDSTAASFFGKRRRAFLDLLLEYSDNGSVLSDADIREEVDTFMFEGHDTTGVNLAWTILLLAAHEKHQKLVQEEIDSIYGDDKEKDLTTADISSMKYLESCVKESLRLYPSVPFIIRETDGDVKLEDGKIIPAGISAIVAIYYIHRNEKYYSDPLSFKPERFLEEDEGKPRHPFAYVPFSAGPRNCIGQKFAILEEKIILANFFRHYRVETDMDIDKIIAVPDIILRSKDGVFVKIYKR